LRVGDFQVSSEYVVHASNRLNSVVANLATTPPAEGKSYGCAGSFGVGAGDHVTSFNLQNATVRDILDRLVESAGFNIWLVTFPEAQKPAQGAMLKTTSIFNPGSAPSDAPRWDLLLPGYDRERKAFGLGWQRGDWQPVAVGPAN
jgi:hypothetical protein